MRALLLCLCLPLSALLPRPALAQVTTNSSALDALKPAPTPAPAASTPPPVSPDLVKPEKVRRPTRPVMRHPAHPAAPAKLPAVPVAPPLNPVIVPPPQNLPVHARPLPPPVPVKPDAQGSVEALPGGVRLTFGPGTADLNAATHQALLDIAAQAKADPSLTITITAWAPGPVDDPSTPRRVSLDRALAARAVLINAGVVSDRIQPLAEGFLHIEGGPPDRADIVLSHPKATPAGTPVAPATGTSEKPGSEKSGGQKSASPAPKI